MKHPKSIRILQNKTRFNKFSINERERAEARLGMVKERLFIFSLAVDTILLTF